MRKNTASQKSGGTVREIVVPCITLTVTCVIIALLLAVTNGIRIMIQYEDPSLALVIALSLVGTVIISKMVGCMLPLFASKVHLDPAIMASPLITTLVDIFSILIYFNIATMLFDL